MTDKKKYLKKELSLITGDFPFKEEIKNKTFFITGATGFLGSAMVYCLSELNKKYGLNLKIICFVRNEEKAKALFADEKVEYITGDLNSDFNLPETIDFIYHFASPTDSKYFITNPVETFISNIVFTKRLAEKSMNCGVKSFVYLSSLEVYGTDGQERELFETSSALLNLLNVRNSYPLAKISCEELLYMYFRVHGLPIKIARLTQTFGEGIDYGDNRVFAQFARSVAENRDIILKSKGETKRSYCYVTDAVSALFYILLKGVNGEAYNVSNDGTYVSISELAEMFCKHNKAISVEYQIEDESKTGYLPVNKVLLNNAKLKSLGWKSRYRIETMVKKFCDYFVAIKD